MEREYNAQLDARWDDVSTIHGRTPGTHRRGIAAGLMLGTIALMLAGLASITGDARAQQPGLDEFADDADQLASADVRSAPRSYIFFRLREPVRGRSVMRARVLEVNIGGTPTSFAGGRDVRKVPFENDPNFEARTYDVSALQQLLGTPPNSTGSAPSDAYIVVQIVAPEGDDAQEEVTVGQIEEIIWPETWLDIFRRQMDVAAALGVNEHLEALQAFREELDVTIQEEFSDAMREAFFEEVVTQFRTMRETAPQDPRLPLELGAFLFELGQLDAELGVYVRAANRGLYDTDGELAYRLARTYFEVLDLSETALDTLEQVPFPPTTPVGIESAVLRMRALMAVGRPGAIPTIAAETLALLEQVEGRLSADDTVNTPGDGIDDGTDEEPTEAEREAAEAEEEAFRETWDVSTGDLLDWRSQTLRYQGEALLRAGQLYEAARSFVQVPAGSAAFDDSRVLLGACYMSMGLENRVDSSRGDFLLPGADLSSLQRLRQALQGAAREDAEAALQPGSFDPTSGSTLPFDRLASQALCILARAELAAEAREVVEDNRDDLDSDEPQRLMARGNIGGTNQRIAQRALHAWRLDPTSDEPLLILAEHLTRRAYGPLAAGDGGGSAQALQAAREWLQRAERIQPTNAMRWWQLARIQIFQPGGARPAIQSLQSAVRLDPQFVDAQALLGELHVHLVETATRVTTQSGPDVATLIQRAITYFEAAIRVDPTRSDIHAKLGHLYSLRARRSADQARIRSSEFLVNGVGLDQAREAWEQVNGALNQAEASYEAARGVQVRVIDIAERAVQPWIVLDHGTDAGLSAGQTVRIRNNEGSLIDARILNDPPPTPLTCVAEPLEYFDNPDVAPAVEALEPGDAVLEVLLADEDNRVSRSVILYPEAQLVAETGLAFIAYMRDYTDGAQAELDGRYYTPSAALTRAVDGFEQVLRWVPAQDGDIGDILRAHPAYDFARRSYIELTRQQNRLQWVDAFDREVVAPAGEVIDLDLIGLGWRISTRRDEAVGYRSGVNDGILTLAINEGERADGTRTDILRQEAFERFHGVQMDLVVDANTGHPTGLDGSFGLVLQVRDEDADDEDESLVRMSFELDAQGRPIFRYRSNDDGDVIDLAGTSSNGERAADLGDLGRDTRRVRLGERAARQRTLTPISEVKLFRRLLPNRDDFEWVVQIGQAMEYTLPIPDDSILLEDDLGSGEIFRVGVTYRFTRRSEASSVRLDAIRIIRERSEDWIDDEEDRLDDLERN